jgi:hypothetical protein
MDVVFMEGEGDPEPKPTFAPTPAENAEEAAAVRPVIMAGTGVCWSHGEGDLQQLAEELGILVFLDGMGRGCLPQTTTSASPAPAARASSSRRRARRWRPARLPPRLRRLVRRADEDHLATDLSKTRWTSSARLRELAAARAMRRSSGPIIS